MPVTLPCSMVHCIHTMCSRAAQYTVISRAVRGDLPMSLSHCLWDDLGELTERSVLPLSLSC